MDIATFQAYGYFALTLFLVVALYGYIYHLYSSEKKGTRNYEKYGDIALNDELDDDPVDEMAVKQSSSKEAK